jgi:hypothetical protein
VCLQPPTCNGCRGEAGGVVTFIFLQKLAQISAKIIKTNSLVEPADADRPVGPLNLTVIMVVVTVDRLASIQGPLLDAEAEGSGFRA